MNISVLISQSRIVVFLLHYQLERSSTCSYSTINYRAVVRTALVHFILQNVYTLRVLEKMDYLLINVILKVEETLKYLLCVC